MYSSQSQWETDPSERKAQMRSWACLFSDKVTVIGYVHSHTKWHMLQIRALVQWTELQTHLRIKGLRDQRLWVCKCKIACSLGVLICACGSVPLLRHINFQSHHHNANADYTSICGATAAFSSTQVLSRCTMLLLLYLRSVSLMGSDA